MWKTKSRIIANILVGFVFIVFVFSFYNTFSLDTEYKFESSVYEVGEEYIEGVSVNTSVELFYKYFDMDNCSIEVVDDDNKQVSGMVFNGSKTVLYNANGNAIKSYVNIIKGDYNRDGIIDTNDFYDMGKCLVNGCSLDEIDVLSVDIDGDGELHINDLMLLDKAVTSGYTGISISEESIVLQSGEQGRLVAKVEPGYGVNLNVKWSSDDDSIVSVDEAGRVTGHDEGETKVRATTFDGKYSVEAVIKVDNTIQLESYEGTGYLGGNEVKVGIKAIDYEGITCRLDNKEVASCEISDESLVLIPKMTGSSVVTVSSPQYGEVSYNFSVLSTYFNIKPIYVCAKPGSSTAITVSGFNTGELSFVADDNEIIKDAYMTPVENRRMLRIDFGIKQGRTTLNVTEGNGNKTRMVVVDVTDMDIPEYGKFAKVGEEVTFTVVSGNLGKLTCKSNDLSKATCRVDGDKVIVSTLATGSVTVDVYNTFSYEDYYRECGQKQVIVIIQE